MQCARGFGQSLVFTINLRKGDKVEFRNLLVSLAVRQINYTLYFRCVDISRMRKSIGY